MSLARSLSAVLAATLAASALAAPGCIATSDQKLRRQTDDDAGGPGPIDVDGGPGDASNELPPAAPHAVLGVDPPHGPFNGGQRVTLRGNGFASTVRVWFGGAELPSADVVPIDPGRVQVVAPPGATGPVDVITQNGDDASTRAALTDGYTYDAFYLEPASGPVGGGTIVTLHGDATAWDAKTSVLIDLLPCPVSEVRGPTELSCTTPKGAPGTKAVRVTTGDGVKTDVLDAYTYGDSDNGFKGGLSGGALGSSLRVIVLDNYTGDPIPNATVVLGDDLSTAKQASASGVVLYQDAGLGPTRTVTAAMKCFQPETFASVPVDTVTFYLDPVLSPDCAAEGDPPPVGGTPGFAAQVTGELVWKSLNEFKRDGWTNVPPPKSDDEQRVAYVFTATSDASRSFTLPSPSAAVTPDAQGLTGFSFSLNASPGNLVLYALAGIENRAVSPPLFTAYSMGVAKGVSAKPASATADVFIPIDVPLDHTLTMTATGPTPTAAGPDRVQASLAVRVADQLYALLPIGKQTRLIPVTAPIDFVGVPALSGSVAGGAYIVTASAVTGLGAALPRSVVGQLATTTTSQVVALDGFVQVPSLTRPAAGDAWDGRTLEVAFAPGGARVDVITFVIQSGYGLSSWVVAAPGDARSVRLPDLAALGLSGALIPGPVTLKVSAGHMNAFDYGSLQYRQLRPSGWNAYAEDLFFAHL
ncbi:MAG: IPT/TIG domain-containing protein [Sorangiineae bacterium]|nr:IPT/TIG domain-containing protein [Polyangiaceae bacterium]MEB2323950.1 IPT/TIG domain-containing protein [Sorangiineae bacterium]